MDFLQRLLQVDLLPITAQCCVAAMLNFDSSSICVSINNYIFISFVMRFMI